MSTIKATIANVKVGHLTIQGLLFQDGTFGVAIPQLVEIGLISNSTHKNTKNYASQALKRLLGDNFSPHKVKVDSFKQLINALTLTEFEQLLVKLDRSGYIPAQIFRDDLVGLSLFQRDGCHK